MIKATYSEISAHLTLNESPPPEDEFDSDTPTNKFPERKWIRITDTPTVKAHSLKSKVLSCR